MGELSIRRADKNDLQSWSKMRLALWPSHKLSDHLSELTGLLRQDSFQGWMRLMTKNILALLKPQFDHTPTAVIAAVLFSLRVFGSMNYTVILVSVD